MDTLWHKTDYKVDLDQLLWEWDHITSKMSKKHWLGHQTALQHSEYCDDIYRNACGHFSKLGYNKNLKMGVKLVGPRPIQLRYPEIKNESYFNKINPLYEDTIFEKIINDHNGTRARIMLKPQHSTYSIHRDISPKGRYHLAMKTNEGAYFLWPNNKEGHFIRSLHIPDDGHVYWVNTSKMHTFINCGADRFHLVLNR